MRTLLIGLAVMIALLCAHSHAHGQKAAERYIPLGQSPGVSQKYTSIGEIAEADARAKTVTIIESGGRRTVKVTGETRIWLDRSKRKQTNLTGSFADLRAGRRAEVKYRDPTQRQVADWIKVEVAQP